MEAEKEDGRQQDEPGAGSPGGAAADMDSDSLHGGGGGGAGEDEMQEVGNSQDEGLNLKQEGGGHEQAEGGQGQQKQHAAVKKEEEMVVEAEEGNGGDKAADLRTEGGGEEMAHEEAEMKPSISLSVQDLSANEKIDPSQSVNVKSAAAAAPPPPPLAKVKSELERELELYEKTEGRNILPASLDSGDQTDNRKRGPAASSPNEGRKKRGRKVKKEEDDVCFVCFDGGDLVLCDQRSCPKAYHLPCIQRNEDFFKKKGPWHCGWHFCCGVNCSKKASIRCQTCPKAYCASCKKEHNFQFLSPRKGLCYECAPLVRMIERNELVHDDGTKVDFGDRETHEFLFKEYWLDLKAKKSITLPEFDKDGKFVNASAADSDENDASSSESELPEQPEQQEQPGQPEQPEQPEEPEQAEVLGTIDAADDEDAPLGSGKRKERKTKVLNSLSDDFKCTINQEQKEEPIMDIDEKEEEEDDEEEEEDEGDAYRPKEFDSWASKELLSFLKFMKTDTERPVKRTTVIKLLWDHIRANELQSPRRKTLIRCDDQLRTVFGKKTITHRQMLKYLHYHFPPKAAKKGQAQAIDWVKEESEPGDKKNRFQKRLPGSKADSHEFAAINQANISLVYLKRSLMEELLRDPHFDQKVVGTFVRIRVPGMVSRNEMCYRLVQIVGTRVLPDEYKAGKKTTNIVLQIMNLHKKEDLTVDLVSNQDFTEEECKRLRQSIRCGFIKAPTVGDFEQKTLSIREAKLNDWFESETSRLSALRDRANEKGRKKELRECVEKLQRLSDPEYRLRELNKVPAFEADPCMDPEYESSEEASADAVSQGTLASTAEKSRSLNRDEHQSFKRESKPEYTRQDSFGSQPRKDTFERGWDNDHDWKDDGRLNGKQPPAGTPRPFQEPRKDPPPPPPPYAMNLPPPPPPPPLRPPLQVSMSPPPEMLEKEKAWFYQDPSGTVQGPFSFEQLRKWNTTGLFPPDLKVWKSNQSREQGVLLKDALVPKPAWGTPSPQQQQPSYGDAGRGGGAWDAGGAAGGRGDWTPRSGGAGGDWGGTGGMVERPGGSDQWNQSQRHGDMSGGGGGGGYNNESGWGQQQQQQHRSPGWGGGSSPWGSNEGFRNPRMHQSKKGTPCKFYQKGFCRNGESCPFQHA